MPNILKHRFASAKADGADATQIQPSHWNDGHAFVGGVAGDVLTRDPTDATFGANWSPRGDVLLQKQNGQSTSTAAVALLWTLIPAGQLGANDYLTVGVSAAISGALVVPMSLDLYLEDATVGGGAVAVELTGPNGAGELAGYSAGHFDVNIRAAASSQSYVSVTGRGGITAGVQQVRGFAFAGFGGGGGWQGWTSAFYLGLRQRTAVDAGSALYWSLHIRQAR